MHHFGSDVIAAWSYPHPTQYTHTHINTPSPSSLSMAAPASCLSCWSQLTEYKGSGVVVGGMKEGWWGWVGRQLSRCRSPSWVRRGRGSFPATPQPCSCPGTSCPDDCTKQIRDFLTVVVGWRRNRGGVVQSHCMDQLTFNAHPLTPSHHHSIPKLSQTKHAWTCTVSPLTSDHNRTQKG